MVNSGSVNGEPVHASHRMLTDILRGQLHFRGVVITDWQDIENLVTEYHVADTMQEAVTLAVNAGVDMSMIPLVPDDSLDDARPQRPGWGFVNAMRAAVSAGDIPQWRIDQAVGPHPRAEVPPRPVRAPLRRRERRQRDGRGTGHAGALRARPPVRASCC